MNCVIKKCTKCFLEKEHGLKSTWCRDCSKEYQKYYWSVNKRIKGIKPKRNKTEEEMSKYYRERKLKKKYNLTEEEYNIMLENQNNRCAICKSESSLSTTKHFHIDHCHKTNIVRGLLCIKCNMGLGNFNDNIDYLETAINYLKTYQSDDYRTAHL